jgi:glutathione S-transferase
MITLYALGEGFGLPEISPFATKTEVQLKMAGLAYRKVRATPQEGPKGQVPFIDDGDVRVGDSTFIRGYLERTYGLDFDEGLSPRQRAEAWAVERMLENHLFWFGVHDRWLIPQNFAKGPARFFDGAPAPLRDQVRAEALEQVRARVLGAGVTRHSEPEMLALAARSLAALQVILADQPFLYGARPSGVDATAFALLGFLLSPYFESPLQRQAVRFEGLAAYCGRMMALFYPDFPWRAEAGAASVEPQPADIN